MRSFTRAIVCLLCCSVGAAEYQATPETLAGINGKVQPGDTVVLKGGAYGTPIQPAASGVRGRPITYIAAKGETPLFGVNPGADLSGKAFITLDGVSYEGKGRFLVCIDGNNITLQNCSFDGQGEGSFESCRIRNAGEHITIINNRFKNGSDTVSIEGGSGHLVEGNSFDGDVHTCLVLMGVSKSVVRNNTLVNPTMKLMEVFNRRKDGQPSERILVERNHFKHTDPYKKQGSAADAMTLTAKNIIVRRNLVTDCQVGFIMFQSKQAMRGGAESTHCLGNRIYNNVIYGCRVPGGFKMNGMAISVGSPSNEDFTNNMFVNNVFFYNRHSPGRFFQGFPESMAVSFYTGAQPNDFSWINNDIISEKPSEEVFGVRDPAKKTYTLKALEAAFPDKAMGNIGADPMFADPAQFDFHLKSGSPCIDAGAFLTKAIAAGKGKTLKVKDALFFSDGFGRVDPDVLRVGQEKVKAMKVDVDKNEIELDREISWSADAPVTLDYEGAKPDMGAFESGAK